MEEASKAKENIQPVKNPFTPAAPPKTDAAAPVSTAANPFLKTDSKPSPFLIGNSGGNASSKS